MLSKTELEVLKRIAMKNHDIAGALNMPKRTVGNHINKIKIKLNADTRVAAAYAILKKGMLNINDFIIPELIREV